MDNSISINKNVKDSKLILHILANPFKLIFSEMVSVKILKISIIKNTFIGNLVLVQILISLYKGNYYYLVKTFSNYFLDIIINQKARR
jgi:hypothetical protein